MKYLRSKKIAFVLFLLIQMIFINSYAASPDLPTPLNIVREIGVSTVVNGVNVITGDLVHSSVDLVIPGPKPFTLSRFYASSAYDNCAYYNGWCHNHQSVVSFEKTKFGEKDKTHLKASYSDLTGHGAYFIGRYHKHDKQVSVKFNSELIVPGMTNCGNGMISARNNPKHTSMIYDLKKERLSVQTASGSQLNFAHLPELSADFDSFGLSEEIKPDRHRFIYSRDKEDRVWRVQFKTIERDFLLADLQFSLPSEHKMKDLRQFSVVASDGRRVIYNMAKINCTDKKTEKKIRRYLIKEAILPNAPLERYTYSYKDNPLMTKRKRPDGRYLDIEYYMKDREKVEGNKVDTERNPYRLKRVSHLLAPVGCDNKPLRTQLFFYNVHKTEKEEKHKDKKIKSTEDRSGYTRVFDALNRKTVYTYNSDHLLTKIVKYTNLPKHTRYSKENFIWGEKNTNEPGYILAKYLSDASNNTHSARTFTYDDHGNVVRDCFYGNISGNSPPVINNGRSPVENGCERYGKNYSYSQNDILHLMTAEIEDNGKGTLFGYHPGTELLAFKFTTDHGVVKSRNFYDYDWMGALCNTITDNGSGRDKNDFTDVTERHITSIANRQEAAPYGIPREVTEKYVDLSTGKEVLLKRTVNEHSIEGYLLSQQVYDANNNHAYTLAWEYDAHGNILKEINALGHYITRRYDANDNLIYEENASHNRQVVHSYDFSNRLTRKEEIHADGTRLVTSHHYDYVGNRTATIDSQGNRTSLTYDDFNRLTETLYAPIPDQNANLIPTKTTSQYDIAGNVIASTNQRDEYTYGSYNAYGKQISIRHPDGTQEFFEYNLDGTVKKSVAKNGTYSLYVHDCFGRLLEKATYSAQNELLYKTTSVYNAFHLISTTDPEGLITSYTYDGAGRVNSITKGDRLTEYQYNALGQIAETKEWYSPDLFRLKKQKYDLLNRVIEEQIVEGTTGEVLKETSFSYDAEGNLIRQTTHNDAGTATTFTEYNALKMPVKCTDPEGNISHFIYNHNAKNIYGQTVLEITSIDALGNQIITTNNALSKPGMITKKNAMGQILSKKEFFYSGIGDVQTIVETVITQNAAERKVVTTLYHDAQHQVHDLVEAVGTKEQKHTEIRYNNFGQKEAIIKSDGTVIHHEYDKAGRLSRFYASDKSFDYTYTYDRNDNPIQITDLIHHTTTTRVYNPQGRLSSEQLGSGKLIEYEYDALDRPIKVVFPDQSGIVYAYDAAYLKKVMRLTHKGETTYEHSYVKYDSSGNVVQTQLAGNAGSEVNHFDIHGRLKSSEAPTWSETIIYDAVGNLTSAKINDPDLPAECNYTYDDMYQLKSETGIASHQYVCDSLYNCVNKDGVQATINSLNQLLTQGDATYTYSPNGNRIVKDENGLKVFYGYDAQDRLTSVIQDSSKWTYIYDAFNRRLSKQAYTKQGADWILSSETTYLYQGQNEVGSCDATGKIQELRILGVGKGAEIGATVAIELNDAVYVPLHDHNGNIVSMIESATGKIIERYRYSAFGEEKIYDQTGNVVSKSFIANPWRFSSKRVDDETGFVYFGRRYYDPSISRWISPDPIGLEGGPNLYAYVLNSPLNHIDLYGLVAEAIASKPSIDFGGLFNWFSQLISKIPAMSFLGRFIECIGQHCLPVPYVEGCVRSVGGFLAGDGINWSPAVNNQTSVLTEGSIDHTNGEEASVVLPGMMNNEKDARAMGSYVSKALNGQKVNVISNNTSGFASDLLSILGIKCGIPSEMVNATVAELRRLTTTVDHITCYVHSRGGLVLAEALKQLTADERAKITAYTYGSAKLIDIQAYGLRGGGNVVNCKDCIPFLSDPMGYCEAAISKNSHTTFINTRGLPMIGHGFQDYYGDAFLRDTQQFNSKYGIGIL